jgi:hypothetical protein
VRVISPSREANKISHKLETHDTACYHKNSGGVGVFSKGATKNSQQHQEGAMTPHCGARGEEIMLTLKECLEFSDLSEEEVREIAEHERVPEIVAAELGHTLLKTPRGIYIIRNYLLENLERAAATGNLQRARHLGEVITRFNATHHVSAAP